MNATSETNDWFVIENNGHKHSLNMRKSPFIECMQNKLLEEVNSKVRLYIKINWHNGNIIKVITNKNNIMETALRLKYTHEQFYGINYFIKSIQILEYINKNPHIPLRLKHKVSKKSKYGSHYRK